MGESTWISHASRRARRFSLEFAIPYRTVYSTPASTWRWSDWILCRWFAVRDDYWTDELERLLETSSNPKQHLRLDDLANRPPNNTVLLHMQQKAGWTADKVTEVRLAGILNSKLKSSIDRWLKKYKARRFLTDLPIIASREGFNRPLSEAQSWLKRLEVLSMGGI